MSLEMLKEIKLTDMTGVWGDNCRFVFKVDAEAKTCVTGASDAKSS